MKIMIVGNNEFLGQEIAKQLNTEDNTVVLYGMFGDNSYLKDNYWVDDLLHFGTVLMCIEEFMPDLVIYTDNQTSNDSYTIYTKNLERLTNIIDAMTYRKITKLVYISDWSTYGVVPEHMLPITEWTPQYPKTPFGTMKVMSEFMIRNYAELHGIKSVIVRPTEVYGAGQENGVISEIVDCMRDGSEYVIDGGQQLLEFLYIDDFVELLKKIIGGFDTLQYPWEHVIAGTGQPQTLLHAVRCAQSVKHFEVKFQENEKVYSLRSNIGYAQNRYGWNPKTSLKEGITKCL
jgi:UDP-glucose 4-epimerase